MAYQNLKTPLITKNGVSYNLQYDSKNGNVQLISSTSSVATQPIFLNGSYTNSGQSILTSAEQTYLYSEIQSSVRGAYTVGGGTSKGLVLPQWAQLSNQGSAPGQTSPIPVQSASPTSGSTLSGIIDSVGNIASSLLNAGTTLNRFNNQSLYGYAGEKDGTYTYPIDMRINKQDVLSITKYRYNAPYGNLLTGGTAGAINILQSGLTRGQDTGFIGSTAESLGIVHLPMPNTVSDSNSVAWGDEGLNNIAAAISAEVLGNAGSYAGAAGLGAAAGLIPGSPVNPGQGAQIAALGTLIKNLAPGFSDPNSDVIQLAAAMGGSALIKMATGAEVSPETILARGAGVVANNNLELLFNGPTLRSFTFAYKMTARSEPEAKTIRNILKFFKQGMAVKKVTGGGTASNFFLRTPNVFKLDYRSNGSTNKSVNRFKTCALQNFSCNYTADGFWAAYDAGQPVSVSMNMAFTELEPIYDTDYQNAGDSVGY